MNTIIEEEEQYNIDRIKQLKNRELRIIIESYYDIQKLRIAMNSRLYAYRKAGFLQICNPEPLLLKLEALEHELEHELKVIVEQHPLWQEWFCDIRGIGPVMAAGVIAWRDDISKAPTVSAFWKYHGFAPSQTRRSKGVKLDYNPKAKTHCWKVGMQLLKAKSNYSKIYYETKPEYENREDIKAMHNNVIKEIKNKKGETIRIYEAAGGPKSYKLHIHQMSMRKMIKRFLADTWLVWRRIEGLPVIEPYIFSTAAQQKGIAHEHFVEPQTDTVINMKAEKAARRKEHNKK